MGLVVLFVILLYVAVLVVATILGYRFGARRGWSTRKRWLAAVAGFMLIFLPVFWDWLPTIWLHSYYCEKQAGLSVYRTPEQWMQANPGITETLIQFRPAPQVGDGDKYYLQLNQRLRWQIDNSRIYWLVAFVVQHRERVVDTNTGEVLV